MKLKIDRTPTKIQNRYLILGVSISFVGMLLSITYRPYVYSNGINDFGFADTIGSLVAVICFCFLYWGLKESTNCEKNRHIIMATLAFTIIWESLGLVGIWGTFDWKDIIAGTVSGITTYILKEIIDKEVQ